MAAEIMDVRDDLNHVENLLKALMLIAANPTIADPAAEAIAEVAAVALSSLGVADGRLRVKRYDRFERVAQDEKRGKASRVERRPGSREWIAAFCAEADPYNAAMARFMFETAARIAQAVALTPADLDLRNRRVWLKAQKGHDATWVTISHEMMIELANLTPKRPVNRKTGEVLEPRVFGYGSSTGYRKRWRTICKRAGIEPLSAHEAGRHGFYTELTVRQGIDPVTAAKAGRWSDVTLPLRAYGHAEADEGAIRELVRTGPVHDQAGQRIKRLKANE